MTLPRWLVSAIAAMAPLSPASQAAQLQFSTGIEYSSGDYGENTDTDAVVVPFSARITFGSFSLRASAPWLAVRGPADIVPVVDDDGGDRGANGGGGPAGGPGGGPGKSGPGGKGGPAAAPGEVEFADDREVRGLGDATLSAAWSFADIAGSRLYLDLTGRLRLPTGSQSRGLGRGKASYATLAEAGWDGDRGGVFMLGGRQFLKSSATVRRRDLWQASTGGWVNAGASSLVGIQGNWRQSSTSAGTAPRSVDVFLNVGLSTAWRLDLSGTAGFGKASPDYAAGVGVTWRAANR